jgi:hypothetical protein
MSQERKLLEEFAQLKKEHAEFDAKAKAAKKALEVKEQIIVQLLQQQGAVTTAKYEGLGFARLRDPEVKTARFPKENEDDFFGFVREQGQGEIIKLTIHPTTLRSFVKGCLEEGEDLPPYLFYEQVQKLTYYDRSKK